MSINIKIRYWIISYLLVALIFVSHPNTCFLFWTPVIIRRCLRKNPLMVWFLPQIYLLCSYPWEISRLAVRKGGGEGGCCAHEVRCVNLGGGVDSNRWVGAGVRDAILVQDIYCAKNNLKPDAQSGSQLWKGLRTQYPWSGREYNLMTVITIRQWNQPLTCKIGSSVFAAIIWLKVVITT